MNATIQKTNQLLRINGSKLLPQLAAQAGDLKYRYGKLAYDALGTILQGPATEIRDTASNMTLDRLQRGSLANENEASVVFATAAYLDVARENRGRRMTVTEHIEKAMDALDDLLAAGW